MKAILQGVWQKDRRGFVQLLVLNIAVALTGGISTVMLVPMLDLLQIEVDGSGMQTILRPFGQLSYLHRAILIIAIFVILVILQAVLRGGSAVKENAFLERYEMALRQELYGGIHSADWETLSRIKHTDFVNLILTQCRQVRICLQLVIGLFASAASAVLQLVIACWLSPSVTGLVLGVGVVFLFLFRPFQKRSRACGQQAVEANRAMYWEVQNQLSSIKEMRAYGVEAENAKLFHQLSQEYYAISRRAAHLRVLPQLCYSIASAVLIALAFVVSVLVLDVDVARLVILVYIFSRLWPVFSSWQGQLQRIQSCVPAFEKIQEMLRRMRRAQHRPARSGQGISLGQAVIFDHVGFTYQDGQTPVLEDVSFTLPAGSVTALVGRSGAGKSTTADLLLGLLRPTQGVILADGVPLQEDNVGQWRKSVGYVPQSPLIMDTTVRENLRRFHPEATEAEMIQALKDALAWPFIEKLEKGLDTVLGTKGVGLSGGEQQRLVLARVLLGAPSLVVLDEATSALDHESERMIRQTIQTLKGKTTVLIIAHRLATIRTADRAVVLENGRVAESGQLSQLLEKENGYLAGMVTGE